MREFLKITGRHLACAQAADVHPSTLGGGHGARIGRTALVPTTRASGIDYKIKPLRQGHMAHHAFSQRRAANIAQTHEKHRCHISPRTRRLAYRRTSVNRGKRRDKSMTRTAAPQWRISQGLTDYAQALAEQQALVEAIAQGQAPEQIWLLEHPSVYTAGTSARAEDLLEPKRFPVHVAGRGGQYTYHGPGQRVGYVMLNLANHGRDVRCFVSALEKWIIDALADFAVAGRIVAGRVGVWVDTPSGEAKIAAIGVRVRRWVSFHGFAINVDPDLSHFSGIIPCGIADHGVTSLAALGIKAAMEDVDAALRRHFPTFLARLDRAPSCAPAGDAAIVRL